MGLYVKFIYQNCHLIYRDIGFISEERENREKWITCHKCKTSERTKRSVQARFLQAKLFSSIEQPILSNIGDSTVCPSAEFRAAFTWSKRKCQINYWKNVFQYLHYLVWLYRVNLGFLRIFWEFLLSMPGQSRIVYIITCDCP